MISTSLRSLFVVLGLVLASALLASPPALWTAVTAAGEQDETYVRGRQALDDERWADAEEAFAATHAAGVQPDASLYWLAYARHKQGNSRAALNTLDRLDREHAGSAWLDDARALRIEIEPRRGGESIDEDEELKLFALQALMQSDDERAVDAVLRFLERDPSPRLQEQALFVLSESRSPRAAQAIADIARGQGKPELRGRAIKTLGINDSPRTLALLEEIYGDTREPELRRQVLEAFMIADQTERLLRVAQTESDPEVRRHAISLLGAADGGAELRTLYDNENDPKLRIAILEALMVADEAELLAEAARSARTPEEQLAAVRLLGLVDESEENKELLRTLYSQGDTDVRFAVLEAFFLMDAAEALIAVARTETDPKLRRSAVQKLGMLDESPEALEFLTELLEN